MRESFIYIALATVFNASASLVLKGFMVNQGSDLAILERFKSVPFYFALLLWGLNFIFYSKALENMNVTVAYMVLVSFSMVIIAISSSLLLGERLGSNQVLGILLALAGIFLVLK